MKYQLAIFDLDGTLLDTLEDLADSTNYVLSLHSYPVRTLEEVRRFVGNGIRRLIEQAVPDGASAEVVDTLFAQFIPYYKEHCADKTKPYDGIITLLQNLKQQGVKLAVVSNKAYYAVKELCDNYFPNLFEVSVGEREGIRRKPAPDTVNEVLQLLRIEKEQAVYIGDSEVDVETAKNADMDCIAVDWGFRDKDCLQEAGAKVIVSTTKQVEDIIVHSK